MADLCNGGVSVATDARHLHPLEGRAACVRGMSQQRPKRMKQLLTISGGYEHPSLVHSILYTAAASLLLAACCRPTFDPLAICD